MVGAASAALVAPRRPVAFSHFPHVFLGKFRPVGRRAENRIFRGPIPAWEGDSNSAELICLFLFLVDDKPGGLRHCVDFLLSIRYIGEYFYCILVYILNHIVIS